MKKILLLLLALICLKSYAIHPDSVIMTVAGKEISLAEFEFIASKNNEVDFSNTESVNNYIELFKNFKLKVAEAETKGLHESKEFNKEFNGYKAQLIAGYLSDKDSEEAYLREIFNRLGEELEISQIVFTLPAKSTSKDTLSVYQEAMKIYNRLVAGESFEAVGEELNQAHDEWHKHHDHGDGHHHHGHNHEAHIHVAYQKAPSYTAMQSVKAFENAAYSLSPGEFSRPVRTLFGYHIIKLHSRKPTPAVNEGQITFENEKNTLRSAMSQGERNFELYRGYDERMRKEYGYIFYQDAYNELMQLCDDFFPSDNSFYEQVKDWDKPLFQLFGRDFPQNEFAYYMLRSPISAKTYGVDFMQEIYDLFIREIISKQERNNLYDKYPEINHLLQEYRDGMLLFEISNMELWNKPSEEQAELESKWLEQLSSKYPVVVNWDVVKKINKK